MPAANSTITKPMTPKVFRLDETELLSCVAGFMLDGWVNEVTLLWMEDESGRAEAVLDEAEVMLKVRTPDQSPRTPMASIALTLQ